MSGMYQAVSDTAKHGGMKIGPLIVDGSCRGEYEESIEGHPDGSFN